MESKVDVPRRDLIHLELVGKCWRINHPDEQLEQSDTDIQKEVCWLFVILALPLRDTLLACTRRAKKKLEGRISP